ncbi:MAG: glycoside hydrolase family 16 protein [Saprospiraceae bacterium]|nr:glycoside hydrolase family 16 protein [Saprospiraceae bacterium]
MNYTIKNIVKIGSLIVTALFIVVISGCNPDETQTVVNFTELTWEDNFDTDGAPNSANWAYEIGDGTAQGIPGWGNNELQTYTDRQENVVVEDGMLKITARQEQFGGRNYTSGRILTKGLFEQSYGRFEARIKLPWGQGLWPAFWMLGDDVGGTVSWPQIGEIDIMENRGSEPTITHGTVHGPGYSGGESIGKSYELTNSRYDTEFHVFGVEWGPDYINFYVDDVLYNQITPADVTGEWVFNDNPFYLILNVAVGGSFSGNPNANTVFPQTMYVDYVRVYK